MENAKSKKVTKLRSEVSVNSVKYTTEMTGREKYIAYQGWAAQLHAYRTKTQNQSE